jgi:hypothetical protein
MEIFLCACVTTIIFGLIIDSNLHQKRRLEHDYRTQDRKLLHSEDMENRKLLHSEAYGHVELSEFEALKKEVADLRKETDKSDLITTLNHNQSVVNEALLDSNDKIEALRKDIDLIKTAMSENADAINNNVQTTFDLFDEFYIMLVEVRTHAEENRDALNGLADTVRPVILKSQASLEADVKPAEPAEPVKPVDDSCETLRGSDRHLYLTACRNELGL